VRAAFEAALFTSASDKANTRRERAACMGRVRQWWTLYRAITFAVMIPIMSYFAIRKRFPITALLILAPLCIILAWGNYSSFKNERDSK
jgi:hypothetical protein